MDKVGVVIPYCNRSERWDGLRDVIRSIEKNLTNLNEIHIIGDSPLWANHNLDVILKEVEYSKNTKVRNFNYCHSMWLSAICDDISEDFVYMADDYYLLKPVSSDEIKDKVLVRSNLEACTQAQRIEMCSQSEWNTLLWKTADFLLEAGFPAWSYETGTPKVINRGQLKDCFAYFGYGNGELIWQTAYFNMFPPEIKSGFLSEETVYKAGFYQPEGKDLIEEKTKEAVYLNHDDNGVCMQLKEYIGNAFPEPSRYE